MVAASVSPFIQRPLYKQGEFLKATTECLIADVPVVTADRRTHLNESEQKQQGGHTNIHHLFQNTRTSEIAELT